MNRGVFTLAEQKDGRVLPVSFEVLNRGLGLAARAGAPLIAVVLGHALDDAGARELIEHGADRVLIADHPALAHFVAEAYAAILAYIIESYHPEILIAAATTTGRTVMPYTAVKVRTGLTADCTELDIDPETGRLLQTRPAIGGNILATIQTPEARPQMATVRPHSTKPAPRQPGRTGEIIRVPVPDDVLADIHTRWLGFTADESQDVTIQEAEVVVAGGRGLGKGENFAALQELAGALGAAVGASRDAVDRGWIGYPHQVGLSGKTVSPRLYFAFGISGAVQHIAGIQTAGTIVAVNKDPDAQIFRLADFGIVGDLNEVLPVLLKRLKERRGSEGSVTA